MEEGKAEGEGKGEGEKAAGEEEAKAEAGKRVAVKEVEGCRDTEAAAEDTMSAFSIASIHL